MSIVHVVSRESGSFSSQMSSWQVLRSMWYSKTCYILHCSHSMKDSQQKWEEKQNPNCYCSKDHRFCESLVHIKESSTATTTCWIISSIHAGRKSLAFNLSPKTTRARMLATTRPLNKVWINSAAYWKQRNPKRFREKKGARERERDEVNRFPWDSFLFTRTILLLSSRFRAKALGEHLRIEFRFMTLGPVFTTATSKSDTMTPKKRRKKNTADRLHILHYSWIGTKRFKPLQKSPYQSCFIMRWSINLQNYTCSW